MPDVNRKARLQTSTRRPIYIPEPANPKDARRKLQGGRRGYTTARHRLVIGQLQNGRNGRPWTEILTAAGYSENTAQAPSKVTSSLGFLELLEEALPDEQLQEVHKGLLLSQKLDHMTFPLGPVGEDDSNFSGSSPNMNASLEQAERTSLTDEEIKELIAGVGGTVRRIVHGDSARHVYFWSPNATARQAALKLAYELKGYTGKAAEQQPIGNTYNTFIQQNNLNPNAPDSKQLVDKTLDMLMDATKARKD
jgi:hypothetical protein